MSTHALALTTAFLFVANLGWYLGHESEKSPMTPERRVKTLLGIAFDVFIIWLLVRTIR